jgi:integrase
MEGLRLRVKDVDFEKCEIVVRDPKGHHDRVTMLPASLIGPLQDHLRLVKRQHDDDLRTGYGAVFMPDALARKYPSASREWGWQYIFPADHLSRDPDIAIMRRHHVDESALQKAIRAAARRACINKPVGPHTLRHCFATHLLESGYDIRTVHAWRPTHSAQRSGTWAELPGHKDVKTTMIYTHVLNRGGLAVRSPLD